MIAWFLWMAWAVAGGADPAVHLSWRGPVGTLWLRAPAGEHVAEDAPFDVVLTIGSRQLLVEGMGDDLAPGLLIGDVRGVAIEGRVMASLCEDGGTRCRLVEVAVAGQTTDRRRGSLSLDVGPWSEPAPPKPEHPGFPRRVDAQAAWETARSQAIASDAPLLLDFGAVWCPPCQLMDAEVFFAEPRPAVVGALVRAWIDVDDPSSWTLKDRYDVGGYPSLVAVDPASGDVLGRLVGYPGQDETLAWLNAIVEGTLEADLTDPGPTEAGTLAWRAVREAREDDARSLLEVAQRAPDHVPFRLARFHLDPTVGDARWLAERAPDQALDWVGALRGDAKEDAAARSVVFGAAREALDGASPQDAADLLSVMAGLVEDPEQEKALYAAAATALRGALTGDMARDKGLIGWMAWLEEHAGFEASALGRLEAARSRFSDEPTFHLSTARMLLRLEMPAVALSAARTARNTSWGDNTLLAARVEAQAMMALGREEQARALVDDVLGALEAPDPGTEVRTHRLRDALRAVVDGDGS